MHLRSGKNNLLLLTISGPRKKAGRNYLCWDEPLKPGFCESPVADWKKRTDIIRLWDKKKYFPENPSRLLSSDDRRRDEGCLNDNKRNWVLSLWMRYIFRRKECFTTLLSSKRFFMKDIPMTVQYSLKRMSKTAKILTLNVSVTSFLSVWVGKTRSFFADF